MFVCLLYVLFVVVLVGCFLFVCLFGVCFVFVLLVCCLLGVVVGCFVFVLLVCCLFVALLLLFSALFCFDSKSAMCWL